MSYTSVVTACIYAASILEVTIEVDIRPGLPHFQIIGLPDKQIDEARTRVRSAIKNSSFVFPKGRITVNLSPSNLPKSGTGFDLGIAVAILASEGKHRLPLKGEWILGELSLDGKVRSFQYLPILLAHSLRTKCRGCLVPILDQNELSLLRAQPLLEVSSLKEAVQALDNQKPYIVGKVSQRLLRSEPITAYAIDQVKGQQQAKRSLAIALAGNHNIFFSGPPGCGKTMLAEAATELLPDLRNEQFLELIQVYRLSKTALLSLSRRPPYIAPHHSISKSALLGGGQSMQPGEISLAHHGILFLDEFPEFSREVREALRQPLQNKEVVLVRDGYTYLFPANCLVIAAQNGCFCGMRNATGATCVCTPAELLRYDRKISQAILDRFDMYIEMSKVQPTDLKVELSEDLRGETIAKKVERVRSNPVKIKDNILLDLAQKDREMEAIIARAITRGNMSTRSVTKLLRVAQTIAMYEGREVFCLEDLQEALQYRQKPSIQ